MPLGIRQNYFVSASYFTVSVVRNDYITVFYYPTNTIMFRCSIFPRCIPPVSHYGTCPTTTIKTHDRYTVYVNSYSGVVFLTSQTLDYFSTYE